MAVRKASQTRRWNDLRPVTIERFPKAGAAAPGSVLITQGGTRVLCTASVSTDLPPWLRPAKGEPATQGWVTAEYAMLPGSTPDRARRGPNSRATEIQRLIGRVLRAAVDLEKIPGLLITCDCDVVTADGGTRTASITGAFVALADALAWAKAQNLVKTNPLHGPVAAISVGLIDGKPRLDLDYELDVRAEVDLNVAMNHRGQFIEVQGTGEKGVFSRAQLDELLDLAARGIRRLITVQRAALRQ
jgi:ribonuclease PH